MAADFGEAIKNAPWFLRTDAKGKEQFAVWVDVPTVNKTIPSEDILTGYDLQYLWEQAKERAS